MDKEFKETVIKFIEAFEKVFDEDWHYTKVKLCIVEDSKEQQQNDFDLGLETIYSISLNGTFINPKVDNEVEDWGNRGDLLFLYRKLKQLL